MAQYALGKIAEDKNNENRDLKEAVKWYGMAVDNGNDYAAYRAGKILIDRESGLYDRDKALSYFRMGAENYNEYAQYELGKAYLDQEYYNLPEALKWLEKSAEKNVHALYKLGTLYQNVESEIYNMDTAIQYYEKAALQGHEASLYRLGKIYSDKENPKYYNIDRAVGCFKSAAEKEMNMHSTRWGAYVWIKILKIIMTWEKRCPILKRQWKRIFRQQSIRQEKSIWKKEVNILTSIKV